MILTGLDFESAKAQLDQQHEHKKKRSRIISKRRLVFDTDESVIRKTSTHGTGFFIGCFLFSKIVN